MTAAASFDDGTFSALLETINLSSRSIFALSGVATRNLPFAERVWSCIRKHMVAIGDSEAPEMRATWYLIDAIIKDCPVVFVPVISPKLCDYIRHQMPWHTVKDDANAALWCDELIRSWIDVLPPALFASVKRTAVQLRQGHELEAELSLQHVFARSRQGASGVLAALAGDGDVEIVERPATRAQIERLASDWDAFTDTVLTGLSESTPTSGAQATAEAPPPVAAAPPPIAKVEVVDVEDDDTEFVPLPQMGSTGRVLPALDFSDLATARAPRKRPR
jgi:hypothetical protein